MEQLKIEYVNINEIKPYSKNAKLHPAEQIEQIKKSIEQFGMDDPIGVWNNEIVEGHGRLIACKELGYTEVPIIRLDHLTDEERKAYTLAHNKLTMNSDFDLDILNDELMNSFDTIDMSDFGFDLDFDKILNDDTEENNPYTTKINIPQYEIKGEEPEISELDDEVKVNELLDKIEKSNVSEEQKEFLRKAATRHYGFNYSKIAEYYAHQDKEMQELMEESALVIIDYDDAIKNGYAELKKEIDIMAKDEVEEFYDEN